MAWYRGKQKKLRRFAKKYGKKAFRKTPYGRAYTAAEWTYKAGKWVKKKAPEVKHGRRPRPPMGRRTKSRRGSSSSSPKNQYRRGNRKYWYYRGKRFYRR